MSVSGPRQIHKQWKQDCRAHCKLLSSSCLRRTVLSSEKRRNCTLCATKWPGYGPELPAGRSDGHSRSESSRRSGPSGSGSSAHDKGSGVWFESIPHDAPDWVKEMAKTAMDPNYGDVEAQMLYRKLLKGTKGKLSVIQLFTKGAKSRAILFIRKFHPLILEIPTRLYRYNLTIIPLE